jgi:putative membrane protein
MAERFRQNDFAGGLVYAVDRVGQVLAEHFPRQQGDLNELPDAVVEE